MENGGRELHQGAGRNEAKLCGERGAGETPNNWLEMERCTCSEECRFVKVYILSHASIKHLFFHHIDASKLESSFFHAPSCRSKLPGKIFPNQNSVREEDL